MNEKYLDTEKTCKLLNMARSTLYAYVNKQQIPFIKLSGKLLFSEKDINKWIDTKKSTVIKDNAT